VGGLGRHLVSFFIGALISKFRVKELVLDALSLPNVYRFIPVGIDRGGSMVDSRL
jgi:hypothetical protein